MGTLLKVLFPPSFQVQEWRGAGATDRGHAPPAAHDPPAVRAAAARPLRSVLPAAEAGAQDLLRAGAVLLSPHPGHQRGARSVDGAAQGDRGQAHSRGIIELPTFRFIYYYVQGWKVRDFYPQTQGN